MFVERVLEVLIYIYIPPEVYKPYIAIDYLHEHHYYNSATASNSSHSEAVPTEEGVDG